MLPDPVIIELSGKDGGQPTLWLKVVRVVEPQLGAHPGNILQFSVKLTSQHLRGGEGESRFEAASSDSVLIKSLSAFVADLEALREQKTVKLVTLGGCMDLAIHSFGHCGEALVEVSVHWPTKQWQKKPVAHSDVQPPFTVSTAFITDQSYLSIVQGQIHAVMREVDRARDCAE
jgi:hypothetical protein